MTDEPDDRKSMAHNPAASGPPRRTVLAGAAAALAPAATAGPPSLTGHPLRNQPAPPLAGVTVQGARVDLARFLGKVVVIEFWGVWCPDCRNDAPYAAALAQSLATRPDAAFLTVHRRASFNRWPTLQAYLEETGFSAPTLLDANESISAAWQVKWVPSYYVIDRSLRIADLRTDLGAAGVRELLTLVDRLRMARA